MKGTPFICNKGVSIFNSPLLKTEKFLIYIIYLDSYSFTRLTVYVNFIWKESLNILSMSAKRTITSHWTQKDHTYDLEIQVLDWDLKKVKKNPSSLNKCTLFVHINTFPPSLVPIGPVISMKPITMQVYRPQPQSDYNTYLLYQHSGEVHSIQHYVIKFVSDLRQVGGFSLVSSTNITDRQRYNWNIVKSSVKHHKPN